MSKIKNATSFVADRLSKTTVRGLYDRGQLTFEQLNAFMKIEELLVSLRTTINAEMKTLLRNQVNPLIALERENSFSLTDITQ